MQGCPHRQHAARQAIDRSSPHLAGFIIGFMGMTTSPLTANAQVACCLADATCQLLLHNNCIDQGGEPYPPGSTCETVACSEYAWLQPPRLRESEPSPGCYEKWDEVSFLHGSQLVADDFILTETAPISAIHWWGTYRHWFDPVPPPDAPNFFYFAVWSHVDGDPEAPFLDFPRPDTVLHDWYVPRSALSEVHTTCTVDVSNANILGTGFFYRWTIPEQVRFTAQAGTRYWLTVATTLIDPACDCDADVAPPFNTYNQADRDFIDAQVGCPVGSGDPDCDAADLNCDGLVDDVDVEIARCQVIFGFADPKCCLPQFYKHHWGWVAREQTGLHPAVRIFTPIDPTVGSTVGSAEVIQTNDAERIDLSFTLIPGEPTPPDPLPPGSYRHNCWLVQESDKPNGALEAGVPRNPCGPELE